MDTSAAFDRISVPVCVVDEHRRIVGWNEPATEFFGRSARSVMGREWHNIVHTTKGHECCAVCDTRKALRHGDPAVPVDVALEVEGYERDVTMVPVPMESGTREDLAFLIIDHGINFHNPAASAHTPIPFRSQVRRLDEDRIIDELTPREREVLACVVEGFDARSIATKVGISHATARNYVQRILSKLGVRNKAEAVNVALTYNLLAS